MQRRTENATLHCLLPYTTHQDQSQQHVCGAGSSCNTAYDHADGARPTAQAGPSHEKSGCRQDEQHSGSPKRHIDHPFIASSRSVKSRSWPTKRSFI